MDLPLTPSFGVVGGFDRKYLDRYFATTHIRANVAVQRGEGGAPLLNMKGEVVGILISSLDQGSASFALPIEAAEKVHRDFIRYGAVRPGWFGLQIEAVSEPIHGSTAIVRDLLHAGHAEKAGIKEGDVFLRIGQSKITCPEDMLDATFFLTAEDTVPVAVARGDTELTVQVCPTDPPKRQAGPPSLWPWEPKAADELLRLGGPWIPKSGR
jgi:S1-C subfamily serine protease